MRLEEELMENIWYGNQDGIGVINFVVPVGEETFLQFRSRYCNHNNKRHVNTDLIMYHKGRKHGKRINNVGRKNYSLVDYIAHEIEVV